jgi:hypothetical protein
MKAIRAMRVGVRSTEESTKCKVEDSGQSASGTTSARTTLASGDQRCPIDESAGARLRHRRYAEPARPGSRAHWSVRRVPAR